MARPSTKTIKHLFGVSGNQCAFPDCTQPLVTDGTVTGEVCHIKAQSVGGPRYDKTQTEQERHDFENLVLMCPVHHKVIDDNPKQYTFERLLEIKQQHEDRYAGGLSQATKWRGSFLSR